MAHKEMSKGHKKVKKVMHEFKEGKLHSGSKHGPKVTNPIRLKLLHFLKNEKLIKQQQSLRKRNMLALAASVS